jgi:hypothetical protein
MPVESTNRIPLRQARSSIGLRPGQRRRRGRVGSSGLSRSHNSSETSHQSTAPPTRSNLHSPDSARSSRIAHSDIGSKRDGAGQRDPSDRECPPDAARDRPVWHADGTPALCPPARISAQCSKRESASGRWPEALNSLRGLRYPRMATTPA